MDYTNLSLSFTHHNKNVTLTAKPQAQLPLASTHQVKRLLQTHSTTELFQIQILPPSPIPQPELTPQHPIPEIQSLLLRFPTLFHS